MVGNIQKVAFVLPRRDAGHRAHLGIAHLAAAEGFADIRQGPRLRATRTLSRAAPKPMPHFQLRPMGAANFPIVTELRFTGHLLMLELA